MVLGATRRVRNLCSLYRIMSISTSSAAKAIELSFEAESSESLHFQLQCKLQGYAALGCIRKAGEVLYSMRCLPGKPTVHDYNSLIYWYMKSKTVNIDELGRIYLGMKRFGPSPNAITFNTLLNGMVSLGRLSNGILIAKEMYKYGFLPSFSALSKLLKKSIGLGNLSDSLSLLEFMLRLEYVPTEPSLRKLFLALCKAGRVHEAFIISDLISKDCFQGAHCFNPLLWALCKSTNGHDALAFLCFLKKKGFECDIYSYTALVYLYARERSWKEVFRCLNMMETDDCKPNVITYTIAIKFLSDDGKVDESLHLLNQMENKGCSPDLVTYNIIFRMLCHHDRLAELGELVQVFGQKGFTPDRYTDAALAGGCMKSGKTRIAERSIYRVISSCSYVDVVLYNIYFNLLCNDNRTEEVWSEMERMIEIGIEPTTVSYNTILKGICNEESIHKGMGFFNQIVWSMNKHDLISFNKLLCAACKQGNSAIIKRILYVMEYEDFELDIVRSCCLILYFCMVRKTATCLKLLDYIISCGSQVKIQTFHSLIRLLCKNRLVGQAYTLYTYLITAGVSPDASTYNILVRASLIECNYFLVDQLLGDMYNQSLRLDTLTQDFFCRLSKEGKLSTDLQLRYHMLENGTIPTKLEATLAS